MFYKGKRIKKLEQEVDKLNKKIAAIELELQQRQKNDRQIKLLREYIQNKIDFLLEDMGIPIISRGEQS